MRIIPLLLMLAFCTSNSHAQRVLHFTRTSGWDHQTRGASYGMFQAIADELQLDVDDDQTGDAFSDPGTLAQYSVIVFSNTSGNAILNEQQRANFEAWVADGGHVLGIHAASDTYRHSSANGNNTGAWDFYAELIGASVQENPNHVSGTPQYSMEHIVAHTSTADLPDPWVKSEEYYYWEGGYYGPNNTEVLRVEETVGPNGQVNSYDAPRPMSWYRVLPEGSRVFYTALGHTTDNFTTDFLFRTHIRDALRWLLDGTTGINEDNLNEPMVPHVVVDDVLRILTGTEQLGAMLILYDVLGRRTHALRVASNTVLIDLHGNRPGVYILSIGEHYRSRVILAR